MSGAGHHITRAHVVMVGDGLDGRKLLIIGLLLAVAAVLSAATVRAGRRGAHQDRSPRRLEAVTEANTAALDDHERRVAELQAEVGRLKLLLAQAYEAAEVPPPAGLSASPRLHVIGG